MCPHVGSCSRLQLRVVFVSCRRAPIMQSTTPGCVCVVSQGANHAVYHSGLCLCRVAGRQSCSLPLRVVFVSCRRAPIMQSTTPCCVCVVSQGANHAVYHSGLCLCRVAGRQSCSLPLRVVFVSCRRAPIMQSTTPCCVCVVSQGADHAVYHSGLCLCRVAGRRSCSLPLRVVFVSCRRAPIMESTTPGCVCVVSQGADHAVYHSGLCLCRVAGRRSCSLPLRVVFVSCRRAPIMQSTTPCCVCVVSQGADHAVYHSVLCLCRVAGRRSWSLPLRVVFVSCRRAPIMQSTTSGCVCVVSQGADHAVADRSI